MLLATKRQTGEYPWTTGPATSPPWARKLRHQHNMTASLCRNNVPSGALMNAAQKR
jgi:hypothetical protein